MTRQYHPNHFHGSHRQRYADLHIHSIYSDGTLTPNEILVKCVDNGIKVLAITDHDTVSGIEEAMALVPDGLEVIPAVEMSSNIGDLDIHILGYYIDHHDPRLIDYLDAFKKHRVQRVKRIIKNLDKDGIHLEFEQIKAAAASHRAFYAKAPMPEGMESTPGEYAMDHSAYLYLMDPEGVYAHVFSPTDTAEEIAAAIRGYMNQ